LGMRKVKRLYLEFVPEHYELYLEPDRDNAVFTGRVMIAGRKSGRPSHRITLHQKDLKIKNAKIIKHDKKSGPAVIKVDRINLHKSLDELRLHTKDQLFPGEYQIELEFSGKITKPMHGIYPCNFSIDGQKKQLIATQFESHHAREAFPCVDEPEAKATFSLTLKTPAGETVISNTPVKDQQKSAGSMITEFEKTPKMSTYLLAFAYGELAYKEAKTKNNVKVRVYATPDKVGLTDFALDTAVRCLDFFEDYYDVPYPLPKQDLIGLPDFSAGAMENWGLITFRESVLYVDAKSTSVETKQYVAMVVCHELAHMWFGNLVTMKWWNDLWLNESFANLMEYRAVDKLYPEWNIWRDFVQREVGSALARDALPNVQPVQAEVNHPDELGALFDPAIVYAKGGSLLNMVRNLIGEDAFRKGLKTYFEDFSYSNAVADDLWQHLQAASGLDVGELMNNWLTQPGYPVIDANLDPAKKELSLFQQRLVVSPKPIKSSTVWQVPLAASQKLAEEILDSQSAHFKIQPVNNYPLFLNHNGKSYFISHYTNSKHMSVILEAVERNILSPIDRLVLVQSNLLLERAGVISTLENIQLLPAYKNEREETVWGMLAGIIGNARSLIYKDQQLETKLNGFIRPVVAPLIKELGWDSSKSDSPQTQKLRALALSLAAAAEDPEVLKEGLARFKKFKQPADLSPDIRATVYFVAVRNGTAADFDKLISFYKELNNADEKDEIASELTSTRDPVKINQLLDMITGKHVRLQDASTWFAWLMRNRYATDLAWKWLNDNWDWVEKNYASDKSYDRFPRYAGMVFSKPEQLKEYRAFFEPRMTTAIELPVKLGIEEIEGRIAWRQRNEQAVKDWVSNRAQ
jgi:aminopeptidase N